MWRMILCSMILSFAAASSLIAQTGDAKKSHWAFQPLKRPPLPEVKHKDWPRNPIDAFILARLEKEKLTPSKEAERTTLIQTSCSKSSATAAMPTERSKNRYTPASCRSYSCSKAGASPRA